MTMSMIILGLILIKVICIILFFFLSYFNVLFYYLSVLCIVQALKFIF